MASFFGGLKQRGDPDDLTLTEMMIFLSKYMTVIYRMDEGFDT